VSSALSYRQLFLKRWKLSQVLRVKSGEDCLLWPDPGGREDAGLPLLLTVLQSRE